MVDWCRSCLSFWDSLLFNTKIWLLAMEEIPSARVPILFNFRTVLLCKHAFDGPESGSRNPKPHDYREIDRKEG